MPVIHRAANILLV
uniref:Uncharacterized protein n=1 Tax=Anguilla anguilla TaxID=7936 RepID=A0A0E9QXC5_ANGAN